jgi:hypothetical protein
VEHALNVAEILARAGLATPATARHERAVTADSAVARAATVVTAATERRHGTDLLGSTRRPSMPNRRVVVHFRIASDPSNAEATVLGAPNESLDSIVSDLQERHGLVEWRLRCAKETR